MADEIAPGAVNPGTPAAATASTERNPVSADNSAIRAMRQELEASQARAKAAETAAAEAKAALTARERAEMAEIDRLKAELGDKQTLEAEAVRLRDEHGRFASAFEELYNAEMSQVVEEKREAVKLLSGAGAWPDRLSALRAARALMGPSAISAGTTTNPGAAGPAPGTTPPAQRVTDARLLPRLTDPGIFKRSAE